VNDCPVIPVLAPRLTFHDRKAFGDMLALPFADGERDSLPSPEDLKYKILLKGILPLFRFTSSSRCLIGTL
jgi:hypothetical protein